jgi:hypothetical protein
MLRFFLKLITENFPSFGYVGELLFGWRSRIIDLELNMEFDDMMEDMEKEYEEEEEGIIMNVAIVDEKAYFVMDNVFYEADIDMDTEQVDKDSAEPIDAHSLTATEMNRMLFILDNLNAE